MIKEDLSGDAECLIRDAVIKRDETKLKKGMIKAMEFFLTGNLVQDDLEDFSLMYLTMPINDESIKEIEFKDEKLRYVVQTLASSLQELSERKVNLKVKRFLAYLKDEDYEKIS